jgi:excisionase family DNA binding protein
MPRPISTEEAAAELGISRRRIAAMILNKQIPTRRIGRSLYVYQADLDAVRIRKPGRPRKNN